MVSSHNLMKQSSAAIPNAGGAYQRLLNQVTRIAHGRDKIHSLRQASSNRGVQHVTGSIIVARFEARSGKPQGKRCMALLHGSTEGRVFPFPIKVMRRFSAAGRSLGVLRPAFD